MFSSFAHTSAFCLVQNMQDANGIEEGLLLTRSLRMAHGDEEPSEAANDHSAEGRRVRFS